MYMIKVLSREEMKEKYSFVTRDDFARDHGFEDFYDMLGENTRLFSIPTLGGEYNYAYTIHLPNGKWMAMITEAVLSDYHVAYCDTRDEALRHLYEQWLRELREERVQPWSWHGPDPETFGARVCVYPTAIYLEEKGGKYPKSMSSDDIKYAVSAPSIEDVISVLGGQENDYMRDENGYWLRIAIPARCAACRRPIQYGQAVYELEGFYYCQADCLAAAIGANYTVFIHPKDR